MLSVASPRHWFLATALLAGCVASAAAEPTRSGAAIYQRLCASCHGPAGEGSQDYPQPLVGDKSVLELARLIDKTMPEGEPDKCRGEDARQAAAYIHEAFYSPAAQARNAPARIELARLTVRQYQNALADLLGSFRGEAAALSRERGLRGEYFRGRRIGGNAALKRTDAAIDFHFGVGSPDEEKLEPHEFSIRWEGSLLAPETAEYEFTIRTEHAGRLWLNGAKQPLIDAWVKSGTETEHRGVIRLIGGRLYPLKLEFTKAKQGVDDSKKQKSPPKSAPASIALLWKLPQRTAEVVPKHWLAPQTSGETFVSTAPFPPDDRSLGYERGTSISKAWEQATTDGAIEAAAAIVAQLDSLAGTSPSAADRPAKLRAFARSFVERAFRRPLTSDLERLYVDGHFRDALPPEASVKRVVLLALKSPRFLYREATTAGNGYDVAARLSFGLWDSLPDRELLRAAGAGELATPQQVAAQAERMLADLRAQAKLREFFRQWLKIDQIPDLAKDERQFAAFTPVVVNDLRTSLELFVDEVVSSDASDFRQLLLAERVPLNGRLAEFFGVDLPADAPFTPAALDAEHRAGVLTHPYLLASFAYTGSSSPIHRGVFISRSLLGRALRPPPEAVAPLAPDLHADLSTRERIELQTKADACRACHGMINPLGFTLEHFDAVGRFRSQEKGRPVDATGSYLTRTGQEARFAGARELAQYLAASEETHAAFVEQLFQFLIKQPVRAYGPELSGQLQQSFRAQQFHIRQLAAQIVARAALPPQP